jgi:hypothetical protein
MPNFPIFFVLTLVSTTYFIKHVTGSWIGPKEAKQIRRDRRKARELAAMEDAIDHTPLTNWQKFVIVNQELKKEKKCPHCGVVYEGDFYQFCGYNIEEEMI